MKNKSIFLIILILNISPFYACNEFNITYLKNIEPILYIHDKDSTGVLNNILLDSGAIADHKNVRILFQGALLQSSNKNKLNNKYGYGREIPQYDIENKFVDIAFVTLYDYKNDYPSGSDITSLLYFERLYNSNIKLPN